MNCPSDRQRHFALANPLVSSLRHYVGFALLHIFDLALRHDHVIDNTLAA
jgi:hypothetical protein